MVKGWTGKYSASKSIDRTGGKMKKYWYQEQVRILQTVFREKDAGQYDAGSVIRYMKETDTNCLVVNAGGVVDFFPNNLEMGKAGHFMGSQDILKDLTRECHENGIRIIARVDFRGMPYSGFFPT